MNESPELPQDSAAPDPFPIARLPGESAAAFQALHGYLRMEKRSLRRLAEEIDVSETTIKEWSSKFNWQQRLADYDLALLRACFKKQVSIQTGAAEASAECDKLIQNAMTSISVDMFTMGHATVQHQVRKNPAAVPIPIGIKMINSAVNMAKSRKVESDHRSASMVALEKKLTAYAADYEQEKQAAKSLPTPAAPPSASDTPEHQ